MSILKTENLKITLDGAMAFEDISFEMVKKRILKAKETFMSKSGKKGVYDLGLIEENRLESLLALGKKTEADAEVLENTISQKETLLTGLSTEANGLFALLKNAEKIKKASLLERYVEVCKKEQEIKELKEQLEQYKESLKTMKNNLTEVKELNKVLVNQISSLSLQLKQ
jgi:chromosome segregation ATPase